MFKSKNQVIELIEKILLGGKNEKEEDALIDELTKAVPFYEKIYNLIFFSNENLSAEEIYEKAESEHNPIIL
ncbi:MAG: hypothetical protein U0M12_09935 [Acutalibacteraceae bacterium]|nr:hypothetical protein [Acutalibacteraceae bacterium]